MQEFVGDTPVLDRVIRDHPRTRVTHPGWRRSPTRRRTTIDSRRGEELNPAPTRFRIVGVVPAAGFARRLQPIPCSKEVYPVRGRPVMDYLLERMSVAGCSEIRVVTRPEKKDVVENALRRGATVIKAYPATVSESLVAGIAGLSDEDVVLFGFPDTIWAPEDGFLTLLREVDRGYDLVLGLFRARGLERSDVVTLHDESRVVRAIQVKPARPASPWIWGCAAARVRILRGMADFSEPGVYFGILSKRQPILGIELSDSWIDIGTPSALAEVAG
jgi:NDP-sugar pyrophosphorylase family protein